MPVIHCIGSSSRTSGSTRIQLHVNRNKKTFQASGVQWIRSRIHQNPPCVQRGVRGSTRIHHTQISDHFDMDPRTPRFAWQWTTTGEVQDPWRMTVIMPLRLMDPDVRLMPGGSLCTPRCGSRALGMQFCERLE